MPPKLLTDPAPEQYVTRAERWALDYWYLDDPELVREWCNTAWREYAHPADLIDAYADRYDLLDFRSADPFERRTFKKEDY